jgi:hypothetical protein
MGKKDLVFDPPPRDVPLEELALRGSFHRYFEERLDLSSR